MKILLLYDNFIRDFRGQLLLKEVLKESGHDVWMWGSWRKPLEFAQLMNFDVIVGGQIAEAATHRFGKFSKESNIRFVLNSTENTAVPKNFENFIIYNTNELNEDVIDLQTIATRDVYDFIQQHPRLQPENKPKYKFIGFPRLDLTINPIFRQVESEGFRAKHNLKKEGKKYLFISSFLFESAYEGVPQRDLEKWNYAEMKKRTDDLVALTKGILHRMLKEFMEPEDVLLFKRHPWDCSNFFAQNFPYDNCRILDNTDYILPCIDNSDVILHTYSTAAIEAWILNKVTVSIFSNNYKATTTLNHMVNEHMVSSYEELRDLLLNYPAKNPSIKSLDLFSPYLDGKATLRLRTEINKLKPHPNKTRFKAPFKEKWKAMIKEWLIDLGYRKLPIYKKVKPNSKLHDFITWENQRSTVIAQYKKAFRKYAKENKKVTGY